LPGRLDHCDRQRAYRLRLKSLRSTPSARTATVTHQGSRLDSSSVMVTDPRSKYSAEAITPQSSSLRSDWEFLKCCFCRHMGRFLNPFPDP
jgi:hypothetical protein